jgi:GNAT superfamily N-acetyltransferase
VIREKFVERTSHQLRNPEFSLVTAHQDGELAGFAFGLPIEAGQWFAEDTAPPEEILTARKFAVIELDVRRAWRRRGIGRALMNELLAGRSEQYAMLGTLVDSPARPMYERWGWRQAATSLPGDEFPPMDTLVLPLRHPA